MRVLDGLVRSHIVGGTFPGAEILLARRGEILHHQAYGTFDGRENSLLSLGRVWDLASVTKPIVTANLAVKLHREGEIDLFAPVADYLPSTYLINHFGVSLLDLALHRAGLAPTSDTVRNAKTVDDAQQALMSIAPRRDKIGQTQYSCVGYILLGAILSHVTGKPLDQLFGEKVSRPLGLKQTLFNPLQNGIVPRDIVPTSPNDSEKGYLRGVVNDTTARAMNRVSGNAGLFSRADELYKIAALMLAERDPLLFGTDERVTGNSRTVGFERILASPEKQLLLLDGAIGHTGHTGTALYICPQSQTILISLTNRSYVSPRENLHQMHAFRQALCELDVLEAAA